MESLMETKEKEIIERELSFLVEVTLKLENELNEIVKNSK